MRALLLVAALAAPASLAFGDDAEDVNGPAATFHKHQLGISLRSGIGVHGIATYSDSTYCGTLDASRPSGLARVCSGRAPFAVDLEAAFGVAMHVELTLELRIGIERDFGPTQGTTGPRPLHVAPGARFFFSEAKRTKLFVQPELVFDLADYAGRGKDFGFRGLEGFWIDFHRTYGIYFYVAETAEFSRWLEGEIEGGFGFQGRYP